MPQSGLFVGTLSGLFLSSESGLGKNLEFSSQTLSNELPLPEGEGVHCFKTLRLNSSIRSSQDPQHNLAF